VFKEMDFGFGRVFEELGFQLGFWEFFYMKNIRS
jgi:hypothetical protein